MNITHISKMEVSKYNTCSGLRGMIEKTFPDAPTLSARERKLIGLFSEIGAEREIGIKVHLAGMEPHEQYMPITLRSSDLSALVVNKSVRDIQYSDITFAIKSNQLLPDAVNYINSQILSHRGPIICDIAPDQKPSLKAIDMFLSSALTDKSSHMFEKINSFFACATVPQEPLIFSDNSYALKTAKEIVGNNYRLSIMFSKLSGQEFSEFELNVIHKYSIGLELGVDFPIIVLNPIQFAGKNDGAEWFYHINSKDLRQIIGSGIFAIPQHILTIIVKDIKL